VPRARSSPHPSSSAGRIHPGRWRLEFRPSLVEKARRVSHRHFAGRRKSRPPPTTIPLTDRMMGERNASARIIRALSSRIPPRCEARLVSSPSSSAIGRLQWESVFASIVLPNPGGPISRNFCGCHARHFRAPASSLVVVAAICPGHPQFHPYWRLPLHLCFVIHFYRMKRLSRASSSNRLLQAGDSTANTFIIHPFHHGCLTRICFRTTTF